jgi:hypothetical protein
VESQQPRNQRRNQTHIKQLGIAIDRQNHRQAEQIQNNIRVSRLLPLANTQISRPSLKPIDMSAADKIVLTLIFVD